MKKFHYLIFIEQYKKHVFQVLGIEAVRNLNMLHQCTKRTIKLTKITKIIIDQKASHLNLAGFTKTL